MDDSFQCEALCLLVGENPLPNAVAAMLLAAPEGTVTLFHTRETAPVALHLSACLKTFGLSQLELKELSETDASSIFQSLHQQLTKLNPQRIGLHYTGGTKPMSVHAYRAIEQWAAEHRATAVYSYLDARELKLYVDPAEPGSGERGHAAYVGRAVTISLNTLLALHGWSLKRAVTTEPKWPASAIALAHACDQPKTFSVWKRWTCDVLRARCRRTDKDEWKSATELKPIILELPADAAFRVVVTALQADMDLDDACIPLDQFQVRRDMHAVCAWLDGKWLEHYVLACLRDTASDLKLHEYGQNIETHELQFDVDVVALRGYQLFAISCSTDETPGLLKHKLFEAYIRARQLGGDEAQVALVCCSAEPGKLEEQMRRDLDPEGRIRVFGRDDLAGLKDLLAQWVREQSKEG